ncbi:MAG: Eco57I restriction-modification methylase domain-containing protein [Turneriella sp.]
MDGEKSRLTAQKPDADASVPITAPDSVLKLVQKFQDGYDGYVSKSTRFTETEARVQFINPFFEALGWDVTNKKGALPGFQEVWHEDTVRVEGKSKAPDYSFRLGRQRLFFLEAKKPSVIIEKGSEADQAAYQTRRYGYSAGLSLSILTDFHEFAVYDTTIRPKPNDKAHVARILYLKYDEYAERFDEIAAIFSKESCEKGLLHAFAKNKTRFKGTSPLDKDFLADMEDWRLTLAKNLAARNEKLTVEELSRAVQLIIDRILFLRVAEDRGLERYGRLGDCAKAKDVYAELKKYFLDADDKYNSGLFHFSAERGRTSEVDNLTTALTLDNKILGDIINGLYPPASPYEFSAITSDILGSAYEQFLGSVISLSKGHRARVEQKPEVRHAGGVYYTPKYIVDFIVESTLGEKLARTTPKQAKVRVLDPACGSGSFLVGAYEYLMRWALDWYVKHDPLKHPQAVYSPNTQDSAVGKVWRLTIAEKKRLLLTHIYGVDIDANAVEVTKLNLMLKALEDENSATVALAFASRKKDNQTQSLGFRERILPDLDKNIHCGNSVVGLDYFDGRLPENVPSDERRKINAFDYEHAFAGSAGFDIVIGNPPYVRQEILGADFKRYAQKTFKTYAGTADLYTYFIEKSLGLLAKDGTYSVIVANKWLRANYGEPLRQFLRTKRIDHIVDFGDLQVFAGATTYPCILKASNRAPDDFFVCNVPSLDFDNLAALVAQKQFKVSLANLAKSGGWSLVNDAEAKLLAKIKAAGVPLGEYVGGKIYRGVLTGLNEAFVIDDETRQRLIKEDKKSAEVIKPFLLGRDIKKYQEPETKRFLIFARRGIDIRVYPAIEKHLSRYKIQLTPKPKDYKGVKWPGRKPGAYKWYELQDSIDYFGEFEKSKILYQEIMTYQSFTFDTSGVFPNNKLFLIPTEEKYLLGLLNSKLIWFSLRNLTTSLQGGALAMQTPQVSQIPIHRINENDPAEVKIRDRITSLVESMLALNKQLAAARESGAAAQAQTQLTRQIEATDREIDRLVYQLYGLSEEEVKIVEGAD